MDPAVAALIGAGTGALVAVASQFIGHELSLSRDRSNQRRQRLTEAVVEAGSLLYRPERSDPPSMDEVMEGMHPESIAASDPDLYRQLMPMHDAVSRGLTLLMIHLGHDHPLIEKYGDTISLIETAEREWILHRRKGDTEEALEEIPRLSDLLQDAQLARGSWME